MRCFSKKKTPANGIVFDYCLEQEMIFRCEVLSKMLLHGIRGTNQSKRATPDHSYCTLLQITGE